MPLLEAPAKFSLHSDAETVTLGKAAMKLTNVWHFNPKKISAIFPFPLQTIELRYGLASAGVDSLGFSTELSPGESFLFYDTVFTLQMLSLTPQKGGNRQAFTAGAGTVEMVSRTAPKQTKACPLGEWIRVSMAQICAIENGPSFSVWRLGEHRARIAKVTDSGELRNWLTLDLGIASDENWSLRGRNFDAANGSLEVMVTKRSTTRTSIAPAPAFNKAFWFTLDSPQLMPGGFQIAAHGVEITRYGTLGLQFEATKLDQDARVYAGQRLYRYTGGDDEESSTEDSEFTLCGSSYTLTALGFRQSEHKTEVQLKLRTTELPKFAYGQPFTLQSGQANFVRFSAKFIEGPQAEVLGFLGESHRHGRDDKGHPATWGWIDFRLYTPAQTYKLHLPIEQFLPGYIWTAGNHKIEVVEPRTEAGAILRVSVKSGS